MSTTTREGEGPNAAPRPRRDDYRPLGSVGHLGLVQDRNDHPTPVEALFNPKESPARPRLAPREVL